MGEHYLDKIREFVFQQSRLSFEGRKKETLRQRLLPRLQELGFHGYRSYWEHLLVNRQETVELYELLTTNETSFFRNPQQFAYLKDVVLPEMELDRGRAAFSTLARGAEPGARSQMRLRVFCAGCSTGEEPYSMAMTLLEALRYPKAWDLQIVAGDLSASCLERARAGYYEEARLRGIPVELRERYLSPQPGGAVVRDELKRLVSFHPLNLNELMNGAAAPGDDGRGFDIIFCRNVMIYFSPSCQQLLVETLYRLLAPGGYLLTGDAEPLHLFTHDFVPVREAGCLIYKKGETVTDA